MLRILTIILVAIVSLISQLNLRYVSSKLFLDSKFTLPSDKLYFLGLIVQAGLPALLSLIITIYGYSRFPFFQFLIFQTLYFVFAIAADHFLFGTEFSLRFFLATALIITGIVLVGN